ncbi:MAG TPA: hypothetical protein VIG50_10560 [Vicinamibacteria bacterium]|jgi:hypothetical protein
MTKKILAVPLILLAVGCRDRYEGQAGAASSPSPGASPYAETYASPGTMSGSTGDMAGAITATVISVDQSGRTITLRETGTTGGEGRRVNVATIAASSLSGIQAGETVTVTCEAPAGAATGTTGTGTTGTGSTGTGTTGTGTAGTAMGAGSGSLANCTTITTITRSSGATGR